MRYSVGQVLYLLMHKEHTVLPVQVTEKILRTTLEGESVSYIVELPTKNRDTRKLETIDASVYKDTESIKIAMLENATKTIDSIISKSINASKKFKNIKIDAAVPDATLDKEEIQDKEENESVSVDLGNGVVGKISIDTLDGELKDGRHTV